MCVVDTAPCWDCGHLPEEVEHFRSGRHEYRLVSAFGERMVLCDFCVVDFGSYEPGFFGLPPSTRIGLGTQHLVVMEPVLAPQLSKDAHCEGCSRRLKFLTWLEAVRRRHEGEEGNQRP